MQAIEKMWKITSETYLSKCFLEGHLNFVLFEIHFFCELRVQSIFFSEFEEESTGLDKQVNGNINNLKKIYKKQKNAFFLSCHLFQWLTNTVFFLSI